MTNHPLQVLATAACGHVGVCSCCDRYNVVFQNMLFVFPEDDLREFRRMLESENTTFNAGDVCCNGRTIALRTPISNFFLMFSPQEMEQVINMLDEAFLMIEVNKILQY